MFHVDSFYNPRSTFQGPPIPPHHKTPPATPPSQPTPSTSSLPLFSSFSSKHSLLHPHPPTLLQDLITSIKQDSPTPPTPPFSNSSSSSYSYEMATQGKLRHIATSVALLLVLLLLLEKSYPAAAARPVVGLRAVDLSPATHPREGDVELHEKPCHTAAGASSVPGVHRFPRSQKLLEKDYGPLLLSALPRGPVPPSAPGGNGNDIKT